MTVPHSAPHFTFTSQSSWRHWRPHAKLLIPLNGEMSEWLKEHAWKACVGETLPRVRIPLSPPNFASLRLGGSRGLIGHRAVRSRSPRLGSNPSLSAKLRFAPSWRLARAYMASRG